MFDIVLNFPALRFDARQSIDSSEDEPTLREDGTALEIGDVLYLTDTGIELYWTGTAYEPVRLSQKLQQGADALIELLNNAKGV